MGQIVLYSLRNVEMCWPGTVDSGSEFLDSRGARVKYLLAPMAIIQEITEVNYIFCLIIFAYIGLCSTHKCLPRLSSSMTHSMSYLSLMCYQACIMQTSNTERAQ